MTPAPERPRHHNHYAGVRELGCPGCDAESEAMCPYCGRPEGGVHGDHRVRPPLPPTPAPERPHAFVDKRGRNLCDICNEWRGKSVHAVALPPSDPTLLGYPAAPAPDAGLREDRLRSVLLDMLTAFRRDGPSMDSTAEVEFVNRAIDAVRAALSWQAEKE